ncbi:MAG: YihY/virulence factor BrkB family protein [Elusimicrobiaceae bacterium]
MPWKTNLKSFFIRIFRIIRNTAVNAVGNNIIELSAELAFFCLFSIFPFFLFLGGLAASFPRKIGTAVIVEKLKLFLPSYIVPVIDNNLSGMLRHPSHWLSVMTLVFSLLAASVAVSSLMSSINRIYGITDKRHYWLQKLIAILLTLALELVVIVGLAGLVIGPVVKDFLIAVTGHVWLFNFMFGYYRWVTALLSMTLCLFLLYTFGPADLRKVRVAMPGAVFTILGWLVISEGFKEYCQHFAHYALLYGAMSGIIVLMTWFYLLALATVAGAQLNKEIMQEFSIDGKPPLLIKFRKRGAKHD